MKQIPLESVQDGMILAQPIVGTGGNILMGPGSVLKVQMATRLKTWGVQSVWIEASDAESMPSEENIAQKDELREKVEKRFHGKCVNGPMQVLYESILEHVQVNHVG